jgi:competence ComEA-like helix-hairpin-helix protein
MKPRCLFLSGAIMLFLFIASPACAEYYPGLENQLRGVVNINNAHVDEFLKLGLTIEQADNILSFRERCGGFETVEDLLKVEGIRQGHLDKMRPFLRVEGKTFLTYSDPGHG